MFPPPHPSPHLPHLSLPVTVVPRLVRDIRDRDREIWFIRVKGVRRKRVETKSVDRCNNSPALPTPTLIPGLPRDPIRSVCVCMCVCVSLSLSHFLFLFFFFFFYFSIFFSLFSYIFYF